MHCNLTIAIQVAIKNTENLKRMHIYSRIILHSSSWNHFHVTNLSRRCSLKKPTSETSRKTPR